MIWILTNPLYDHTSWQLLEYFVQHYRYLKIFDEKGLNLSIKVTSCIDKIQQYIYCQIKQIGWLMIIV